MRIVEASRYSFVGILRREGRAVKERSGFGEGWLVVSVETGGGAAGGSAPAGLKSGALRG
jgi:hypothetical protein